MNVGILVAIILPFAFIILFVLISDSDWAKSSCYDDVKESDYICEKKELVNQIDKKSNDKRADYLFCVRNVNFIGSDNIPNYMRKIDGYLTSYKLEQFDRFYTVYCKELGDTLKKIRDCKCSSLYYSLVTETRATYGSIFSKMLADIEAFIKDNTTSVADIEGIKNFAKINGDFDENYKSEEAHKSASDTDVVLTSTTSAVENRAKNYADALTRAYEKINQCKKENAQLAKELEKCRAEAKKHNKSTKERLSAIDLKTGDRWDFFNEWDVMSQSERDEYIREVQCLNMFIRDKTGETLTRIAGYIDLNECTYKDVRKHLTRSDRYYDEYVVADDTKFTYRGVPVTIEWVKSTCCSDVRNVRVLMKYPDCTYEAIEFNKEHGRRL